MTTFLTESEKREALALLDKLHEQQRELQKLIEGSLVLVAPGGCAGDADFAGDLEPGDRWLIDGGFEVVESVSPTSRKDLAEVAVRTNCAVRVVPAGQVVEVAR